MAVTIDGRARTVIVYVPASVGSRTAALVFNLHGSGSTAADQRAASGMDRAADAYGFIAAYPQGAIALGAGFAWNVRGQPLAGGAPVPPDAADDTAFIAAAIAAIERHQAVDHQRIYAAGMSGGGRMTSQLGCELSTVLAAVAPVAGLRFPEPCPSERAVPIVAFHGTADAVNPYDGNGEGYWTYGVTTAAERWAGHHGCAPTPDVSRPAPGVRLTSYSGCAGAVELYTVEGAGHEWPGAPDQSTVIDANAAMWEFFSRHPLR